MAAIAQRNKESHRTDFNWCDVGFIKFLIFKVVIENKWREADYDHWIASDPFADSIECDSCGQRLRYSEMERIDSGGYVCDGCLNNNK